MENQALTRQLFKEIAEWVVFDHDGFPVAGSERFLADSPTFFEDISDMMHASEADYFTWKKGQVRFISFVTKIGCFIGKIEAGVPTAKVVFMLPEIERVASRAAGEE